jgi:hypothetical protein
MGLAWHCIFSGPCWSCAVAAGLAGFAPLAAKTLAVLLCLQAGALAVASACCCWVHVLIEQLLVAEDRARFLGPTLAMAGLHTVALPWLWGWGLLLLLLAAAREVLVLHVLQVLLLLVFGGGCEAIVASPSC